MKIALIGYGKMGKVIEKLAVARGHEVVLRISQHNLQELNREKIRMADVAIEFSLPETAFHNICFCLGKNIPVVSGTTGWLENWMRQNQCVPNTKGLSFMLPILVLVSISCLPSTGSLLP
jgi:4-hydroxy-tetrahydrodipicolinate reductase